jgi:HK97 family phage major capsid protein
MTMITGPGSGQAILRPEDVQELVIKPLTQTAVATRVSTVVQTASHSTRFPVLVSEADTAWVAEAAEIPISEAQLEEIVCTPTKVAGVVPISNELRDDSDPAALDVVGQSLVRDAQVKLDAAFFGDTAANGPDGLLSLSDVQVVSWGSVTNLDCFAEALSLAENEGAVITSFVGNPLDTLQLATLKSALDSNQPLLGMDPSIPGARSVFGVPLLSSPAIEPGVFWALPKAKVFTVIRTDSSVVADGSVLFTSDRTALRYVHRVGYAFPHQQAIVKIEHGGS